MVILAPLSKPVNVKVLSNVLLAPNSVFTVVALNVTCVPVIVEETFVPNVVVELIFAVVDALY